MFGNHFLQEQPFKEILKFFESSTAPETAQVGAISEAQKQQKDFKV